MFSRTHGRQAVLGNGAPQALHADHLLTSAALWWVTSAVVASVIAVFVLRRHFRSRHLRSRVRYELLPTTAFDPSLPAVVAFAHQLGRARPVHGWVPRSVVGVRVWFSTDPEFGKMTMSIEGRESINGVLNKPSYPQVEIRRASAASDGETSPVREETPPRQSWQRKNPNRDDCLGEFRRISSWCACGAASERSGRVRCMR
ncbi:MAG TPA: hypothetical protein VG674_18270 [Amycolatopsis sp.]|nr:hypothetical protein [Amycolatopsis sp.]